MRDSDGPPKGFLVGDVVEGKYRIDGIAGEGGMGIVYEAEHVILRQRVALKVIRPGTISSSEVVQRFSSEARAAASITSDHVVRVVDAGVIGRAVPYLVMEWLEGSDLASLVTQRKRLEVPEVVRYTLEALEGLAHAHAAGLIHRDLKPANLFLAQGASGKKTIKLLDFGIARSLEPEDDTKTTGPRVVGSPTYMSPEQLQKATLDPRTDLWSLGVVIFELLTGTAPFEGAFADLVVAIMSGPIPVLHERRPGVPPALSDVVAKCLRRNVSERWADAAEVANALAPLGDEKCLELAVRIQRILAQQAPAKRMRRRYESYESALESLESDWLTGAPETALPAANDVEDTEPPPGLDHPQARVTRVPARPPAAPAENALRVLLIDDSEISLGVHELLLKNAGFDVRATASAGEFEALLEGWAPHLVLMDVEMPEMSGVELCRQVKKRLGTTAPIVLLSDLPLAELEKRAKAAGADSFIAKTGDARRFVADVRDICAMVYSPEDLPG